MFQAVRARRLDVFMPTPAVLALPSPLLAANPPLPILIMLPDSDHPAAGPDAWPCATQAAEWAGPGFYPNGLPRAAEFFEIIV